MNFFNLLFLGKYGNYHKTNWYEALFSKVVGAGRKLIAKFLKIKGNTIVWNQLMPISTRGTQTEGGVTITNNQDGSYSLSGKAIMTPANYWFLGGYATSDDAVLVLKKDHKYLLNSIIVNWPTNSNTGDASVRDIEVGEWAILTVRNADYYSRAVRLAKYEVDKTYNEKIYPMIFDLTQMFGSGNEPSTVDEFTSLFPLPYYSYEQGKLLSFNGEGIKTTGKNRLNYDVWKTAETWNGTSIWENNGVTITATSNDAFTMYSASSFPVNARIPVRVGETIILSWESDDNVSGGVYIFPNGVVAGSVSVNNLVNKSLSYTPVNGVEYVTIRFGVASSGKTIHFKNIMVRFADADSTFEPYTENTTTTPTDTYFPNGMRSAGSVYDELSNNKAITRIGEVDMGTLSWEKNSTYAGLWNASVPLRKIGSLNIICSKYPKTDSTTVITLDKSIAPSGGSATIYVHDSSYSTVTDFKASLNGAMLQYELATPTEVDIDPPLELNYQVWNGGTEQLLPVNTDNPTTSPILADIKYPDGERDNQYFTYRQYLPNSRMMSMALNTIMGKSVEFNQQALDILMKGE